MGVRRRFSKRNYKRNSKGNSKGNSKRRSRSNRKQLRKKRNSKKLRGGASCQLRQLINDDVDKKTAVVSDLTDFLEHAEYTEPVTDQISQTLENRGFKPLDEEARDRVHATMKKILADAALKMVTNANEVKNCGEGMQPELVLAASGSSGFLQNGP